MATMEREARGVCRAETKDAIRARTAALMLNATEPTREGRARLRGLLDALRVTGFSPIMNTRTGRWSVAADALAWTVGLLGFSVLAALAAAGGVE